MLTLRGKLLNIFTTSEYTTTEGKIIPSKTKLQLLTKVPLKNGSYKNELVDLSIPNEKALKYKGKENTDVEVDVAIIGKATFYGI
jgi:hypothetical protein